MPRAVILAFLCLAASLTAAPAVAFPWYPLVDDPATGSLARVPPCADPALSLQVVDRFNEAERNYWDGREQLFRVDGLIERGVHPQRDDKVARRWCEGVAFFAGGARRRIVLELASGTGFVGTGYGLSYCIQGLDRHWAFAPNCRVLRHREF